MENEITKKIIEYIDGTKDFLLETAPSFIQEIILYSITKQLIILSLCIGISIFICILFSSAHKWCKEENKKEDALLQKKYGNNSDADDVHVVIMTILFVCFIVSGGFALNALFELLHAWLAPKLYILRMIRGN